MKEINCKTNGIISSTKFIFQKNNFRRSSLVKSRLNAVAFLNAARVCMCVCVCVHLHSWQLRALCSFTHSHTRGREWGVQFDPTQMISPADNFRKKKNRPIFTFSTNYIPFNSNFNISNFTHPICEPVLFLMRIKRFMWAWSINLRIQKNMNWLFQFLG